MNEEEAKELLAAEAKAAASEAIEDPEFLEKVAKKAAELTPEAAPYVGSDEEVEKQKAINFVRAMRLSKLAAKGDVRASAELKAISNQDSGIEMPPVMRNLIIEHAKDIPDLGDIVERIPMTARVIDTTTGGDIDETGLNVVPEMGAKPVVEFTFGTIRLEAVKVPVIVLVADEFIKDVNWDAVQYVARKIAEALARKRIYNEVAAIVSAADAQNVVLGASIADSMLDLQDAVSSDSAERGYYLMHRTVLSQLKRLKDTSDDYIYQRPSEGRPAMLWDRPVKLIDYMKKYSEAGVIAAFVAPQSVLAGEYGQLSMSTSSEATVVVGSGDTAQTVNLWQQNMTGVRGEIEGDQKAVLPAERIALLTKSA